MNTIRPPRPDALFDSVTLAAVAAEIRTLGAARFSGVRQASPETVVLSLAGTGRLRHLLISVHPRGARVHFTRHRDAAGRTSAFVLLLRGRLPEARIATVEQPPFNRILRLGFDALEGRLWLIAELMGRHSNLTLTDGRVVLGAAKVVSARMSPRRPLLPGRPYVSPPADRPTPEALGLDALAALLSEPGTVEARLSHSLLGVSPTVARELALRAGLDPAGPAAAARGSADRLMEALEALARIIRDGAFAPQIYTDRGRPVAFAPFPMLAYAAWTPEDAATMSDAIDRYYLEAAPASDADPLLDRRRAFAAKITEALERRDAALAASRRTLAERGDADRQRRMGELILTHVTAIRPRDAVLRVTDERAGEEVAIPLDPGRTAVENAQDYFRRYAKARATARAVPERVARLEAEIAALRDALVHVGHASSADDLSELEADLAAAGLAPARPKARKRAPGRPAPKSRGGPRRFRTADGALILVGRSGRENDRVTFREAGPDDLWLHARGIAGAHVVLKSPGPPSEVAVETAAAVAAFFSEGRSAGQVAVDAVPRKHVKKQPGAAPGLVTYSGERTIVVTPAVPAPEW